ncbi:hypothetical protein ACFLTQ_03040 [Chloroflexota bacterium]
MVSLWGQVNVPGQVLEKRLGFDGVQYTYNSTFWKIIQRDPSPLSGMVLNRIAPNLSVFHRQLPTFRCNVMLQVKRPQYLKRRTLGYNGNSPYYRFTIDDEQQNVLATLASKAGSRAYVGYASPAFSKTAELYRHTIYSKLIENSAFVSVVNVVGHKHFAYCGPGTCGKAYSEPEDIDDKSFTTVLEGLAYEDNDWKSQNELETSEALATQALGELNKIIHDVGIGEGKTKNILARDMLQLIDDLDSSWKQDTHQAIKHFSVIQLFCSVYDLLWFTVG